MMIAPNNFERFLGTDIDWKAEKTSPLEQNNNSTATSIDGIFLKAESFYKISEETCNKNSLPVKTATNPPDFITITAIDDSSESCLLNKSSTTAKLLAEYLATLTKKEKMDIRSIEIIQNVFKTKRRAEISFKMDILGSKNVIISKTSLLEPRKEKVFHNIDKSVLEYFTTKTFLYNFKEPKPEKKLREIHNSAGGKWRTKVPEKEAMWKVIVNEHEDIIDYFRKMIGSDYFNEYLLRSFIKNKIKKFQNEKIDELREALLESRDYLIKVAEYQEFKEMVLDALEKAKIKTAAVIGDTAGQLFCKFLFDRRPILLESEEIFLQSLKSLLKEAVIEANIFKVVWMIVKKDQVFEMVKKLAITRLIGRFSKIDCQSQSEEVEAEEGLSESNNCTKKVKI